MAKIRSIKSAINRLLDNKPVFFDDSYRSGEIESLAICSGGESYTVTLKTGAKRGRMRIDGTPYLFTTRDETPF